MTKKVSKIFGKVEMKSTLIMVECGKYSRSNPIVESINLDENSKTVCQSFKKVQEY